MRNMMLSASLIVFSNLAFAKLPAPVLTEEAKSKAAEAAAKTAHGTKMANFQLCKSMDKAAAHYYKTSKANGKDAKPATETPACADPGAFVFPVPVAPVASATAGAPSGAPIAVGAPVAAAGTTGAAKPAVASPAPAKK